MISCLFLRRQSLLSATLTVPTRPFRKYFQDLAIASFSCERKGLFLRKRLFQTKWDDTKTTFFFLSIGWIGSASDRMPVGIYGLLYLLSNPDTIGAASDCYFIGRKLGNSISGRDTLEQFNGVIW